MQKPKVVLLGICVSVFVAALNPMASPPDGDQPSATLLPEALLHLGSGGSYALAVDKKSSRIDIYRQNGNGTITKVHSYRTSTGRAEGDKMVEGDLKTPEGIYYMVRIREDTELMNKYGVRAFDLNYPNELDRMAAKTGYGIWLHGTDEPQRLEAPRTSEGCVVVSNEDLREISDFITLYRTPIIIGESLNYVSTSVVAEQRERVTNFVLRWLDSWANQDIERYGSCYDDSFRGGPARKRAWLQRKKGTFSRTEWANVDVADLKILRDGDHIVVSFYQRYRSNLMDDTGIKWVYIKENADDLKIISEEWHPVRKAVSGKHWNEAEAHLKAVVGELSEVVVEKSGKLAIADPYATLPFKVHGATDTAEVRLAADSARETKKVEAEEEPVRSKPSVATKYVRVDGKPAVAVEEFSIHSLDPRKLNVEFQLVNKQREGARRRGWIHIVAEWNSGSAHSSFPAVRIEGGWPTTATSGDSYGIRWFKVVKASLRRPSPNAELTALHCYIFDRNGRLINDQQLPVRR